MTAVGALAGNGRSIDNASGLYRNRSRLFDVRSGYNGYCGGLELCTAGPRYDGPTGLGTLDGVRGFQPALPAPRGRVSSS